MRKRDDGGCPAVREEIDRGVSQKENECTIAIFDVEVTLRRALSIASVDSSRVYSEKLRRSELRIDPE